MKKIEIDICSAEVTKLLTLLKLRFQVCTFEFVAPSQRYTYRVLQTIEMKLILLCVWAEPAVLGSAKTDLKFKYEI